MKIAFSAPRSLVLLALPSLIAFSCGQPSYTDTDDAALLNFERFYERFHSDSLFQISRIQFPLPGLPSNPSAAQLDGESYFHTLDEWRMHRRIDFDKEPGVTRDVESFGDIVNERICVNNTFCQLRRFYLRDDGWYLIHYDDLNMVRR